MDANKVFNTIIGRTRLKKIDISHSLGMNNNYINNIITKRAIPRADTFAKIIDVCGWDLLVRNRETGEEMRIDPPGTDTNDA